MNNTIFCRRPTELDHVKVIGRKSITREIKKQLFSISPAEVSTTRRKFQVNDPVKQERIETIGRTFLQGYHAAIEADQRHQLQTQLKELPIEYRGFAYEGAAMGIGLMDRLMPWKTAQFEHFLQDEWNHYPYLTHVGLGWSLARIPGGIQRFSKQLISAKRVETEAASMESLLACLVLDGYGFHQGYFAWQKYIQSMVEPNFLPAECQPVVTQGLGRSLCFVLGMNVERIAKTIQHFPRQRQADLWSGVGLATAYAGGLSAEEVARLQQQAAAHQPAFAQGVAFGAKARQRAQHIPEHTRVVTRVIWKQSVESVASLTDTTLADLPPASRLTTYAIWRQRIQDGYVSSMA